MILSLLAFNVTASNSIAAPTPIHLVKIGLSYGDRLVWMSDARLAAALDDAVSLGAGWIRADLSWKNIQYDGRNVRNWALFDRVVDAANKRNLMVLPVLAYTPPWARTGKCDSQSCSPANPEEFAIFAGEAAARYAPKGIHTWEIWNEPNLGFFWAPSPAPVAYNALLQASARVIRKVDPSAKLVLGGLASVITTGNNNMSQFDFLTQVAALGGNRVVDAIGYHPYTYPYLCSTLTTFYTPWERMERGTTSLRRVLSAYGTPDLPIWVTEIGAPTGGPGTASDGSLPIRSTTTHVTETRQAQIAADAVGAASTAPHVGALIWYNDRDVSTDRSSTENFYGLRRADGSAKPAFSAFRAATTALGSSNDRKVPR